jgi:dTDP-4-dehydrorhamnose 3,5-epimerase-like enzyme
MKLLLVANGFRWWLGYQDFTGMDFKNIGVDASYVIYFVNRLYDYLNPDEVRRPWNDSGIIDPKTGDPYDWNKAPFK